MQSAKGELPNVAAVLLNALTVERWQRKSKASLKTDGEMSAKGNDEVPLQDCCKAPLKTDCELPFKQDGSPYLPENGNVFSKRYRNLTFKGYRVIPLKQYRAERLRPADWKRQETRLRTMVRVFECTGKFSSVSKFFAEEAEPVKPLLEELNAGHRALFDLKRGRLTSEQLKENCRESMLPCGPCTDKLQKIRTLLRRRKNTLKPVPWEMSMSS